jgi:CHAT domain-containing protein/Tfp pilus assembly protein PilF
MIRVAVAAAFTAGASALHAQQLPIERMRALATAGEIVALQASVRERPDDARELVRRLLVDASRARDADSVLVIARRVGGAYSAAWEDSFPESQVARFVRMDAPRRRAKVAADSVRRAGNAALGSGGAGRALALWRMALRRAEAIADSAGTAAALGNIGIAHYRAAALDSANAALVQSHALAAAVGDHRTAANALGALGSVAKERGDLRLARERYEDARTLRARIGDIRGTASDHNNLGLIAAELGDAAAARRNYREALALAKRHGLDDAAAAALLNLGNLASGEGEYAEAIRDYHEALALYRALGHEGDAALTLHDLGLLSLRRGDYARAEARLREALSIFLRVGTREDVVAVRRDLAAVAAACGDLQSAMEQLRLADRLLAGAPAAPGLVADLALARGDVATQLNAFADAERQYGRAEALYRRAGEDAARAETQQGIAMLLVERGDYPRAIGLLRTVARGQAVRGDRRPRALTELMLGYAHYRQGDLAAARQTLGRARDSLHALGDVTSEAAALGTLADLELDGGQPRASEALFRRGLELLARRPSAMTWQLRAGLGRALRTRGALADAAAELRSAVDEVERAAAALSSDDWRTMFLADKWDVYTELAVVEHARNDAAAAFAISERLRARQMLDIVARGRVAHRVNADTSLAEREQDLRRQIGELTERLEGRDLVTGGRRGPTLAADLPGGGESTRELLARAQDEYARLLRDLRDREPADLPGMRAPVASWREVAARLREDEALVEYLVADSTTLAFVVTRDTVRALDLGVGRSALEALIDFTRGALVRPSDAAMRRRAGAPWRAPLRRLHERLISPLEKSGALRRATRLIVVPHAELHYLPFAALIGNETSGERESFLVERYEVAYAPSASVWTRLDLRVARGVGRSSQPRVLALAPRARALPGSRDEVGRIRSLYGARATVLVDDAASEQAFRAAAPRYDIVHLATVGVLNKHNPLFSYVSLGPARGTDGRIEVHEVFGLELNARLLVLSACQTALGSGAMADVPAGDDWVGLVRAFLGVGVQKVVATLWPVEDRSTAQLMVRLHQGLEAGRSEATALATAQRAALRVRETADPFYWAGFVLVGSR